MGLESVVAGKPLARLAEPTDGKTLRANQALIVANARPAAQVATALGRIE
jgi:pseudouridine-5'-phosphate glycosidase